MFAIRQNVTAIFVLVPKNILLEPMYCSTQKFRRGCSKNWRGLSPLAGTATAHK